MKRRNPILAISILLIVVLVASIFPLGAFAAVVEEYKDLDVVVLLDTSGSMKYSDPYYVTNSAIKMLVNMMPAKSSRIGLVSFNTEATVLTEQNGSPSLIPLSQLTGVQYVKNIVDNTKHSSLDTGIGNALKAASDLLDTCSDEDNNKAIILFTDGVDDFGFSVATTEAAKQKCAELQNTCLSNEAAAIEWAESNNCPVYCVGFEYTSNALGENGEGIEKLNNYSAQTGGYTKITSDLHEIESLFIDMLANICSLYYREVETIPGDGGHHVVFIDVNPSVIEANIRITCNTEQAIKNGSIELYDPLSNQIELKNGDDVRYDIDATAASIKIIDPDAGQWMLVIDGVVGDEVKIGLLEHYDIQIGTDIDGKNEFGNVYQGDIGHIITRIYDDDVLIEDSDIYDLINSATVTIAHDGAEPEVIEMERNESSYEAPYAFDELGSYTITVNVQADSFFRTNELTILCEERPIIVNEPVRVDIPFNDIPDLPINTAVTVSDILSHASDAEGDSFWIDSVVVEKPDFLQGIYDEASDSIELKGIKRGTSKVFVNYRDAEGNYAQAIFKTTVTDLIGLIKELAIIVAAIILLILLIVFIRLKGRKVYGSFFIRSISISDSRTRLNIEPTRNVYGDTDDRFRVTLSYIVKNMKTVFSKLADSFDYATGLEKKIADYFLCTIEDDRFAPIFMADAEKASLIGTYKGKDGLVIKLQGKDDRFAINDKISGTLKLYDGNSVSIVLHADSSSESVITVQAIYANSKQAKKRRNKTRTAKRRAAAKRARTKSGKAPSKPSISIDVD